MKLQDHFTRNLKLVFKNSSYTLNQFADRISISRSYLQEIFRGTSNPTLATVELIAQRLELEPLALLLYSDKELETMFILMDFLDLLFDLPQEKKELVVNLLSLLVLSDKKTGTD